VLRFWIATYLDKFAHDHYKSRNDVVNTIIILNALAQPTLKIDVIGIFVANSFAEIIDVTCCQIRYQL